MSEKDYSNNFRFTLKQGDVLLCERIFSADCYSPLTRNSINIKDLLPSTIRGLQKLLSKKKSAYETCFYTSENDEINLLEYSQKLIASHKQYQREGMDYNPPTIVQQIEERIIRGVECKLGLYINNNPIVERTFYVDGYNTVARHSMDIEYEVEDIVYRISERIKSNDIKNIWDDYFLINEVGLSVSEIRDLSYYERISMIKRLK